MFANIMIGRYFPGDSVLHRMEPRVKTVLLLVLMVSVFLCADGAGYAVFGIATMGLIRISGVPFAVVCRSLLPLWWILVITFGIHLFGVTDGEMAFTVGAFTATAEGALKGLFMCLRLVLLIVVSSLLSFTTEPLALTDAAESLLSPLKMFGLPAHELAMMMSIALRFIPTLIDETDKIMKAQISRGVDFADGSLRTRAENLLAVLVPLFIACFRRADELALAMDARCYPIGGQGRTRLKESCVTKLDVKAIAAVGCLVAVLLWLRGIRLS